MLRTVSATRYVTPLREGGSLPGLVEADDDGMYVLKFRGAGQGPKALVAELVAGEIGRALGLPVPEIVLVDLDPQLGSAEPDFEVKALLDASPGTNLGLDFLPGAVPFDPAIRQPIDPHLAARIVWFDSFVTNPDRTVRNTNLLVWHRRPWLIDHGAALYIPHTWRDPAAHAVRPFGLIRHHVLLPFAGPIPDADEALAPLVRPEMLDGIVAAIPGSWLAPEPGLPDVASHRRAYTDYLARRLDARHAFVQEAEDARRAA